MAENNKLSHVDADGRAGMVDIQNKVATKRSATAKGFIEMGREVLVLLDEDQLKKGDALQVARLAGIMAAKKTAELIPLCHPLQLSHVDVALERQERGIGITATVRCEGKTGVEMEALTACSLAALTIYDMCKAVDKSMVIREIYLATKDGGKGGSWRTGA